MISIRKIAGNLNYVDDCLTFFASRSKDESLCPKVSEDNKKNVCYYNLAQALEDNLMCKKITSENSANKCVIDIAVQKKDVNECYILDQDAFYLAKCITQVSVTNKDNTFCINIPDEEMRKSCDMQVANAQVQSSS